MMIGGRVCSRVLVGILGCNWVGVGLVQESLSTEARTVEINDVRKTCRVDRYLALTALSQYVTMVSALGVGVTEAVRLPTLTLYVCTELCVPTSHSISLSNHCSIWIVLYTMVLCGFN